MKTQISKPLPLWQGLLFLILAEALVRGIVYQVVVPPWQHYDEPTHFEYVRLIVERHRIPRLGDYDLTMRREIAASMQATGFWKNRGAPTTDFWSSVPPSIGVSELEHPPLYYALLALPQQLVTHQAIETQLYLARAGSVVLYLVVVAAAFGLSCELFPKRPWLTAAVATFVTLLPPFTDLMSGVNNDAGAAATVSLLLWASVRLIRRGPSPRRVAAVILIVGLCFMTKSTAGLISVVVLFALGIGCISRAQRRWLWRGLGVLLPLVVWAVFAWGRHAAYWYGHDRPAAANRLVTDAALGKSVLALSADGRQHPRAVYQELGLSDGQALRGHPVTVGAWLRGVGGSVPVVLSLDDGRTTHRHRVQATSKWEFHAFTASVDPSAPSVAVYALLPRESQVPAGASSPSVYLDGVVLVAGAFDVESPPEFGTAQAESGHWGSRPFANLLRNGSGEVLWLGLRDWVGNAKLYRYPLVDIVHSLRDWQRTGWVYKPELSILFQSFWGRFGWNQVAVPSAYFYPPAVVTALGILGSGLGLLRRLRMARSGDQWRLRAWGMLAIVGLVAWIGTVVRIHPVLVTNNVFWPVARYSYVAIVPTALALCRGLQEVVPPRWLRECAWAGLLGMIALDAVAFWTTVLPYYYR